MTSPLSVGQTIPQLLSTVSGTTQYRETSVSPDGRYVAWTVNLRNTDNTQSRNSEIYLLDLSKPGATRAKNFRRQNAFTPNTALPGRPTANSSRFSRMPRSPASWNSTSNLPAARRAKLTSLTGFLDTPRWSPDGKKIALLFTENAPRAAGPLEPSTRESGVVEEHIYEQRLTLVDPATGKAKPISPADTYVYEFDWAPDSDPLAYTAAKGNGDNNWWIAQLYTISAASGEVHPVYKPPMQIANPRCLPDGKADRVHRRHHERRRLHRRRYLRGPRGRRRRPAQPDAGPQELASWLRWLALHGERSSSTKRSMAAPPSPHSIRPRGLPKPSGRATNRCAAATM